MPTPKLELETTAYTFDQLMHNDAPQLALAGRSNVGKSSVINRLLNRRNFARVGAAPGKTTHINYFLIDSAFYLVDMLMGKKHGDTQKLDFMDESALMEIGNILSGAYLNALFNFTNISLLPSIPALAMDMAGAILSVVLVQLGQMGDHALVIETEFKTEDDGIKGHFFLVPDPGSLEIILQAVGV